ncbi:hypothetical protein GGI23_000303 [Coemansia sp. RSA 2559]|nr:hypothetical protein GGI23_000303 [Coemansia sp. RSA 2559]
MACQTTGSSELEDEWLSTHNGLLAYIAGADTGAIEPGGCVCVRAMVPRAHNSTEAKHGWPTIPGWPADSMMVDLVMESSDDPLYTGARVTVPVDMQESRAQAAGHTQYQGAARLYDPGTYVVDARLEYRAGRWNARAGQPMPPYSEQPMPSAANGVAMRNTVHVTLDRSHPAHLSRHQTLPLCTVGDAAGRWIPAANLAWDARQHLAPVEDARVWVPYHCRLRRISQAEFAYHMSRTHRSVHWYGDSNSRRTLRPFVMGGRWCHEPNTTARLDCLCNDAPKDLFPSEWYQQMPVPHWYRVYGSGVDGGEIFMDHRILGQHPPAQPPPSTANRLASDADFGPAYVPREYEARRDFFDLYYLFTRGTLDMYGSYWARDITSRAVSRYPAASLVVVQLVTWDVAFGEYATFVRSVELLALRLRSVYPHAQFIYRSGPYWCCRAAESDDKRYSRLRFLAFDRYARQVFRRRLGARVWDVMAPQAARPPESKRLAENMPCLSAHSRSEHIHLDNQLLMNMLVNA